MSLRVAMCLLTLSMRRRRRGRCLPLICCAQFKRRSRLRLYQCDASCSTLFFMSDNAHTFAMASEANSRVLSGFLDYLRIEKGLAPLSISAYSTDILQFAQFLEKRKQHLLAARRSDVREFLQQLFSNQVD